MFEAPPHLYSPIEFFSRAYHSAGIYVSFPCPGESCERMSGELLSARDRESGLDVLTMMLILTRYGGFP